jgi:hypothetical protein
MIVQQTNSRKIWVYLIIFCALFLLHCEKSEDDDNFFVATINGQEWRANYIYAIMSSASPPDGIDFIASSISLDEMNNGGWFNNPENNPNLRLFYFTINRDCLEPQVFVFDSHFNADNSCFYLIVDIVDKATNSHFMIYPEINIDPDAHFKGRWEFSEIETTDSGIIEGEFEIDASVFWNQAHEDVDFHLNVTDGKFKATISLTAGSQFIPGLSGFASRSKYARRPEGVGLLNRIR